MSRIGKTPVALADGVSVEAQADTGEIAVSGPKGSLQFRVPPGIEVRVEDGTLFVDSCRADAKGKALHGMSRSILQGMVEGVSKGFERRLELQGVGYRSQCKGQHLTMSLGFSHPVEYEVPEGVTVSMPDNTTIVLQSIDKQLIGQTAATIRGFRPPDAYKGKGIRYAGEQITLKEGKTVA